MRTWLSTLPSEYFVSSRAAASSTASLIAIPRLPGEFGSCSSTFLPDCVSELGLATTCASPSSDTQSGKKVLRSEEHTSELQSRSDIVCRLLLEKKKKRKNDIDK